MSIYDDLGYLKLQYLAENLDIFLKHWKKDQKIEARSVVERLVELEVIDKKNRSTLSRIKSAKLGKFRQISEFDYDWPKCIQKEKIDEAIVCEFIKIKKNIILAGPEGLGKTMIAKNIGWQAIQYGYRTLFTTASDMVINLGSQESTAARHRCIKKYTKPDLLIIDELGYLSFDITSADLLFDVISKRYETGSVIITTNLAFRDWIKIFPGAACVSAMIDRLTHHCEILKIDGSSYRAANSTANPKGKNRENKKS